MAKKQSKSAWKNLFCGGIAGGVEVLINYPTEFVKTQLQLYGKDAKVVRFHTPIDVIKSTLKTKGPTGFYQGMWPVFFGSIPKASVRFAANGQAKAWLRDENGKLSFAGSLAAGLFSGVSESIIAVTPMETIKTKLIHDQGMAKPRFKGSFHGIKTMIMEDGIASIYKGLGPTTTKQGANQMVRFSLMDTFKGKRRTMVGDPNYVFPLYEILVFGAIAGFISVYATMPFDVVKTKMQGLESTQYKNSFDCGMKVVKSDGITGLWKGATPRIARVAVSTSIIFTTYEATMKFMDPELYAKTPVAL